MWVKDTFALPFGESENPWYSKVLDDFSPPEINLTMLGSPTDLLNALNEAYEDEIQAKVEDAYAHYTEKITGSFSNVNEFYTNWTHEVRSIYNVEALADILRPDDYDPPRYVSTIENITDLVQEEQHYNDTSEVRSPN